MHNADEFLTYIAQNEKELKYAVKKNITYDKELFDDCFQSSIIKVYDSIVANDRYVKDFKNYFFLSFKFNYINDQNKLRRRQNKEMNLEDYKECTSSQFLTDDLNECTDDDLTPEERIADLRNVLEANFGTLRTNIYLDYKTAKCDGGINYKTIADEYSVPVSMVQTCIKKIDEFLTIDSADKYSINVPLF